MNEAKRWIAKAKAGDAEALAFFSGLFTQEDGCWLCDEPVGAGGSISTFPDPETPGAAIMTPICGGCFGLPQMMRKRHEMAVNPGDVAARQVERLALGRRQHKFAPPLDSSCRTPSYSRTKRYSGANGKTNLVWRHRPILFGHDVP
jgi:hypothetical protein